MRKVVFKNNKVEDYTFILSNKALQLCGQIPSVQNVKFSGSLNSKQEVSFTVYRDQQILNSSLSIQEIEKYKRYVWDNLLDLKVIYIKELDIYFEIRISTEDKEDTVKNIIGTSLSEAELSQINLYSTEINSEDDIARDNYKVTTFFNEEDPEASLLNRILQKAPHYKIKHVDKSLCKLQRTFSIDGQSIYDFFTGDCSEQFDCLFQFDSSDRSISVYDLMTVCEDCGKRGEFTDICPKCGGNNLNYFGEDTSIYVDKNNLTDAITIEMDGDSIKNCFKLEGGDENMNAAIRNLNPNGSDYIYALREEDKADMPTELVEKLAAYDELYDSYIEEYQGLTERLYDLTDDILYYKSSMMPTIEHSQITATTEAEKLTATALSPIALEKLTTSTTISTVNSALKTYAKTIVKSGYVKLEIENGATFEYVGIDDDDWNYGTWYGRFKVINYSDKEDVVYSDYLTITVNDDYLKFVEQKIQKDINSNDDDDNYVFDVLSIDELEDFKYAITLYSLNRLKSFYEAIQSAMSVLADLGHSEEGADLYEPLYLPYYYKSIACQEEIDRRQTAIDELQHELDLCKERQTEINTDLNLQNYLGDLYTVFCSYRREDTFENSNYISDGLDNTQLLDNAKKFFELAKKEIVKSSTGVITITSTLYNFLAMKEFQPLVYYFDLGNWIRIRADRQLYRLRIIGYEIDFGNLQTINVTFSTVTKIKNVHTDKDDIINSAQSMAKSYSTIVKQMEQTKESSDTLNSILENGLSSALVEIRNNNNEEVTYGKRGLLLRKYDDILDDYTDKQCLLTHNSMIYTRDNWKTAALALGEHEYTYYDKENNVFATAKDYGLSSKFVQAGYIYGSQIISGDIYSENYSSIAGSHLNLNDGSFSFAGGKLKGVVNDDNTYTLSVQGVINSSNIIGSTLIGGSINIGENFSVDEEGTMTTSNGIFNGVIHAANGGTIAGFNIGDKAIYSGTESLSSTTPGVYLGTDGIRQYNSHSSYVNISGGKLTCNNAQISGIYEHYNSNGNKAIEIKNNHISIYGWWDGATDECMGTVCSVQSLKGTDIGALGILAQNENRVFLGYENDDKNTTAAILVNKETIENGGVPFIINGANGAIFDDVDGGGITVKNGLITGWNINGVANGSFSVLSGMSFSSDGMLTQAKFLHVTVKDGLIAGWTTTTEDY